MPIKEAASTPARSEGQVRTVTSVVGVHGYRREIDGLRALAVVAVIVNHFSKDLLPSGYLGVDIFFVISGYVITASLAGRSGGSLFDLLRGFYFRRVKRLMPALVLCVAITSVVACLFDPTPEVPLITGVTSLFGLSNMFLLKLATDYFGVSAELNFFTQTWSLGVEEQFYLLYPPLLWLTGFSRAGQKTVRRPVLVLALLGVCSLIGFVVLGIVDQPASYFLMPTRLWELGTGALIFMAPPTSVASRTNPTAILVTVLACLFVPARHAIPATVSIVLLTALLIASLRPNTAAHMLLIRRTSVFVGERSYSLYLWHWTVLCTSRWTIGLHWWSVPLQCALMVGLATLSYRYVEKPLRAVRWSRWKVFASAALSVVLCTLVAAVLFKSHNVLFAGSAKAESEFSGITPGYRTRRYFRLADKCRAQQMDAHPILLDRLLASCATTTDIGRLNVVVVGDSHALDLFPMSDDIAAESGIQFLNLWQDGCRFPRKDDEPEYCSYPERILTQVLPRISGDLTLVIRQNYAPKRFGGDLPMYERKLEELIRSSSIHPRLKIVMVAPGPKSLLVADGGGVCSVQPFRPRWALGDHCLSAGQPVQEQQARRADYYSVLLGLEKKYPNFHVYDPFDVLCADEGAGCTFRTAGKPLYRDESHLTELASELLAKPFSAYLTSIGVRPSAAHSTNSQ